MRDATAFPSGGPWADELGVRPTIPARSSRRGGRGGRCGGLCRCCSSSRRVRRRLHPLRCLAIGRSRHGAPRPRRGPARRSGAGGARRSGRPKRRARDKPEGRPCEPRRRARSMLFPGLDRVRRRIAPDSAVRPRPVGGVVRLGPRRGSGRGSIQVGAGRGGLPRRRAQGRSGAEAPEAIAECLVDLAPRLTRCGGDRARFRVRPMAGRCAVRLGPGQDLLPGQMAAPAWPVLVQQAGQRRAPRQTAPARPESFVDRVPRLAGCVAHRAGIAMRPLPRGRMVRVGPGQDLGDAQIRKRRLIAGATVLGQQPGQRGAPRQAPPPLPQPSIDASPGLPRSTQPPCRAVSLGHDPCAL